MHSNRKRYIFILIGVAIIIVFLCCFFREKSINSFVDMDHITRVCVLNGNNGEIFEVTTKDGLDKIEEYMNNIKFRKTIRLILYGGFSYYFDFYNKEEHIARITFGDKVSVDNTEYTISDYNEISLDELVNSIRK